MINELNLPFSGQKAAADFTFIQPGVPDFETEREKENNKRKTSVMLFFVSLSGHVSKLRENKLRLQGGALAPRPANLNLVSDLSGCLGGGLPFTVDPPTKKVVHYMTQQKSL